MDLHTAIEILEYHQAWRLGKKDDMIYTSKQLTDALDIVLFEVKKRNPTPKFKKGGCENDMGRSQIEINKGNWVRHRFFLPNEAITNHLSMIKFEDYTVVPLEQFEVFRFNNSHSIADWLKGWEVCTKPIA